jgi:hypothetical protein
MARRKTSENSAFPDSRNPFRAPPASLAPQVLYRPDEGRGRGRREWWKKTRARPFRIGRCGRLESRSASSPWQSSGEAMPERVWSALAVDGRCQAASGALRSQCRCKASEFTMRAKPRRLRCWRECPMLWVRASYMGVVEVTSDGFGVVAAAEELLEVGVARRDGRRFSVRLSLRAWSSSYRPAPGSRPRRSPTATMPTGSTAWGSCLP